ncbi:MAG: TetR family transcriptional regulator [Sphingobium sp.]|nr:TetR family transcriptional regulator [Sphingobium sp.]
MKVSREQARRNREAVVEAASRLFRARGVEGVAIGEVMRAGGMTHGGFYNQFPSKDALAAEACALALEGSVARWRSIAEEAGGADGAKAIVRDYLSARNRDAPETGCALVSLGAEAARRGGGMAVALREGLDGLVDAYAAAGGVERDAALAAVAQMVGAMMLARAVDDEALSDRLLAATRTALTA